MSSRDALQSDQRPRGLAAHDTDVVGLVFGLFFLVCAALAVAIRTGGLGFGADRPDGAWISGALLAAVGVIGIVGTLATLRRRAAARSTATSVQPPPSRPTEQVWGSEPITWSDGPSGSAEIEADETEVLDPPVARDE